MNQKLKNCIKIALGSSNRFWIKDMLELERGLSSFMG